MRLTLHSTKVLNLSLKQHGVPEEVGNADVWIPESLPSDEKVESKFALNHTAAYAEDSSRAFAIIFDFSTVLPEQSLELELEYLAEFKTDEDISDEFKQSGFPKVNAPAIAFPYLRAFISNLLLSGGHNPVLLPSINFAARNAERDN
ncbi:protein-export chaperone SecB [Stutzerimonas stutzeri]|uniref:protein-export chaperone SecB n=1 Tax=Stutzerimonas stutzeri TaxID=316 RepID=UPI001F225926|nr:protein-export chaperone SecB [Stutzerimonas stutzeri]